MNIAEVTKAFHSLSPKACRLIVDLCKGKIEIDKYDIGKRFDGTRKWVAQCHNFPSQDELIRSALNDVIEGFGVEAIRNPNDSDQVIAEYINTGDTYSATVVYDHETNEYILTTWGDWYEGWVNEQTTDEGDDTIQCGYCSHITPLTGEDENGDPEWSETICEECGRNVSNGELP